MVAIALCGFYDVAMWLLGCYYVITVVFAVFQVVSMVLLDSYL